MSAQVLLDPAVARDFPESQVRLVVARGVQNGQFWPELEESLRSVEDSVAQGAWEPFDEASPRITSWHDAYRRFGSNPRRTRPSLDALSRRLRRDAKLPRINPAVDAYNLISVTRGMPAGAFDLAKLRGVVSIRFAEPGDRFTPLGEPEAAEEPVPGEVIYAQRAEVLTRHWNHRDSDLTKVTGETTDIVFILERVSESAVPTAELEKAQLSLAELIRPHAMKVSLMFISPETPNASLAGG